MRYSAALLLLAAVSLYSCSKTQDREAPKTAAEEPSSQTGAAPKVVVHLKDGSKVPGTIVASSQTDMTVAGDDGIERKIPLGQVQSVDYGAAKAEPAPPASQPKRSARQTQAPSERPNPAPSEPPAQAAQATAEREPAAPLSQPPQTARIYELPAGSEVSVRMNEAIDSGKAAEGQTFAAEVTRDVKDENGAIVLPRGADARVVIRSASKGGRFRGASDLVLDLQSIVINGRTYDIDAVDISKKGKAGVGANKRTAKYTGGGAALGAIVGAIAGGGKGAAIGAGAGAGAGALTQILTKGGAIKVPVETVLTFRLDKPLKVTALE